MIGRESMGNPMIFHQIHEYLTKGEEVISRNNGDLLRKHFKIYEDIIDNFLDDISYSYGNEKYKFVELKRNAIWLTKNIEKSTAIRTRLSIAKNLTQIKAVLKDVEK
jgi:tRNA-dihydrouridine synthase